MFFLACALNPTWREPGLLLGLCLYAGLTIWRIYTFLTIEGISGFPRIAFTLELLLLAAAVLLWFRRP